MSDVDDGVRARTFVAVDLEDPASTALAEAVRPFRARHPGLRWSPSEQWHVTLVFVGSVGADDAAKVDAVVRDRAARAGAMDLRLDGTVGSFGGRVLWAGVREDQRLRALARVLHEALTAEGFSLDSREFVPHCTLTRAPRGAWLPADLTHELATPEAGWHTAQVKVYRSRLRIGGAHHEVRSAHDLSGG